MAVRPVPSLTARPPQDLGFGSVVSGATRRRFLNRDGTFNVRRTGLGFAESRSFYRYLLNISWPRFISHVVYWYLATNAVFAIAYLACGPAALDGPEDYGVGRLGHFLSAYFFSVQTLATIGYGRLVPATRAANLLVALEALAGLLGFAIVSGLLFARFTRPTAKISFSLNALVAPYEGGWALMFRLVNLRNTDLADVHAVVSFARWVVDAKGNRRRRFDQLTLERDAISFMPLHWVIVHPITATSPMHGLTARALAEAEPEIVCLITADDETFAQTVHAKTSYDKSDIVWGGRFRDMYIMDTDHVAIDMAKLSDFDRVEPPGAV